MRTICVEDGFIAIGEPYELAEYVKDTIREEMSKIPSLGWGFMEDGDFPVWLEIATELDRIWMRSNEGMYRLEWHVGAKYQITKEEICAL